MRNIKFKITMGTNYQNPIKLTEIEYYHNSKFEANINETKKTDETKNIDLIIDSFRDILQEDLKNKIINKSGLMVIDIIYIEIVFFQYVPLAGSSYFKITTYLPSKLL